MRINDQLNYLLLLKYEDEEEVDLSGYAEEQIKYHEIYLLEEGYLEGAIAKSFTTKDPLVTGLKPKGHKYLRNIEQQNKQQSEELFNSLKDLWNQVDEENTVKQDNINIVKFRDLLINIFSVEDLEELCFRLHVDDEELGTKNKTVLARKIVKRFQNHRELDKLFEEAMSMRPNSKDEFFACLI